MFVFCFVFCFPFSPNVQSTSPTGVWSEGSEVIPGIVKLRERESSRVNPTFPICRARRVRARGIGMSTV